MSIYWFSPRGWEDREDVEWLLRAGEEAFGFSRSVVQREVRVSCMVPLDSGSLPVYSLNAMFLA